MGIISIITPKNKICRQIPNRKVTTEELTGRNRIEINYFKRNNTIPSLVFRSLRACDFNDLTRPVDILRKTAWLLKPDRPLWNGYMQMISKGTHPGEASIIFMPMRDMSASDKIMQLLHYDFCIATSKKV
jgi:hypothetical protein